MPKSMFCSFAYAHLTSTYNRQFSADEPSGKGKS
jgi:hypothetical protein